MKTEPHLVAGDADARESAATFSGNPFSTRYIRAGAIPYRFIEQGDSIEAFGQRLRRASWRGQIVGPHGSGKTTLLRTLDNHWTAWGREPLVLPIPKSPLGLLKASRRWTHVTQVLVDGFEQSGPLRKIALVMLCRSRDCGLLTTSHTAGLLLPIAHRTRVSEQLATDLVTYLTTCTSAIDRSTVCDHFRKQHGNMRETFLSLYDEVTSRSLK